MCYTISCSETYSIETNIVHARILKTSIFIILNIFLSQMHVLKNLHDIHADTTSNNPQSQYIYRHSRSNTNGRPTSQHQEIGTNAEDYYAVQIGATKVGTKEAKCIISARGTTHRRIWGRSTRGSNPTIAATKN